MPVITIRSGSPVHDAALLALHDVADAGAGVDGFRVIGGHMIALLQLLYHTASGPRMTVDADAGIDTEVAASGWIQNGLAQRVTRSKRAVYRRQNEAGADLAVDLLVPRTDRHRESSSAATVSSRPVDWASLWLSHPFGQKSMRGFTTAKPCSSLCPYPTSRRRSSSRSTHGVSG